MIFLVYYCAVGMPVLSMAAFVMYGFDKRRAKKQGRRIPERTLLAVGQFGGWPGALLAQRVFRHKTAKLSFRIQFIATVVVHVIVVTALTVWIYSAR
jgi:uncharacterized membrane protein YsdA (DUF1294 family)